MGVGIMTDRETLDERYVKKDDCLTKKTLFVTKEICTLKEIAITKSVMDICEKLDKFENNHFVHMQDDMKIMREELSSIKWQVAIISSGASFLITLIIPYLIKAIFGV